MASASSWRILRPLTQGRRSGRVSSPLATHGMSGSSVFLNVSIAQRHSSSRAKKIKCHQSPNTGKCEACKLSKTPCRFRDRERYHAQRAGSMSASSSNFPSDSEDSQSYTESPNLLPRRATLPSFPHYTQQGHLRSSSLPPAMPRLPHGALAEGSAYRSGSPNSEIGPQRIRRSSARLVVGLWTVSLVLF